MSIRRLTIMAGLIALSSAALIGGGPARAQNAIGRAAAVDPAASSETGTATQVLAVGTQVRSNDRVRTDAGGRTRLRFLDQTTLDVGPNSSLVLDRFVFNPDQTASQASMNLARGVFRFVSGASDKRAYDIRTPTATIAIRGTDLLITVTAQATRIVVLDGEITACNRASRRCETVDRRTGRNTATLGSNGINSVSGTVAPPLGPVRAAGRPSRPDMAAGREMATGIVTSGLSAIGPVSPSLPNTTPTLLDPVRRSVIGSGQPRNILTVNLDVVAVGPNGQALSTQRLSLAFPATTVLNATALLGAAVAANPSLTSNPAFSNATLVVTTPYGGSQQFSAPAVLASTANPVLISATGGIPISTATVRVPVR